MNPNYISRLLFFVCFFVLCNDLLAQSPGYRGKHFYVNYEAIPRISYIDGIEAVENIEYRDEDGNSLDFDGMLNSLNVKHNVGIHYIFSRGGIIGLEATLSAPQYFSRREESTGLYKHYRSKGRIFSVNYKRFNFIRKGYIAPIGNFIELRPVLYMNKVEELGRYNISSYLGNVYIPNLSAQTLNSDSFTGLGIAFAFGMQTIWFERLIPNYTFGFTYIPSLRQNSNYNLSGDAARAHSRALLADAGWFIDIKVGLGLLLF